MFQKPFLTDLRQPPTEPEPFPYGGTLRNYEGPLVDKAPTFFDLERSPILSKVPNRVTNISRVILPAADGGKIAIIL